MVAARLRVDSIAAGGDGVARHDGLAVFVPRTAPGDLVDVAFEARGRFARGSVRSIVEPSPLRTQPLCVHYVRDRCGGCQLQHVAYPAQLVAKETIVRDAMQRIGKREVAGVHVHPSPSEWRYRTKLTLALRWTGGGWIAGLHRYDNPDVVFQLEECPITDDRVVAIWGDVLASAELLPRVRELRGAVRLTSDDGASFVLEGGREWSRARDLADRVPALTSIWWEPVGGHRRILVDRRAASVEQSGSVPKPPDASFAQVNARGAALLHAHVVSLVLAHSPSTVVDAYAGAGATAIDLAKRGVRVTAIELDAASGRWVAARLPAGSRSVIGRVEASLPDALPADVVILNPPRTGVDPEVTATLQRSALPVVVYVSCNPATLARDVQRMPGYRIASMTSFDMFPQTAHVETVCELVPEAA